MELIEQITRKEEEYKFLTGEVNELQKSMKNSLLLQDKLFIEFYKKHKKFHVKEEEWKKDKESYLCQLQELKRENKNLVDFRE